MSNRPAGYHPAAQPATQMLRGLEEVYARSVQKFLGYPKALMKARASSSAGRRRTVSLTVRRILPDASGAATEIDFRASLSRKAPGSRDVRRSRAILLPGRIRSMRKR